MKNQYNQQLEDLKKEYTNMKTQSESFYENSDYAQKKLRANADDLQDRLSKREEELAIAEGELSKTKRALEEAESKVADMTEKCAVLADELDVANAKASQLLRAEATVAVYRKRLEGLGAMGQQIADLEDQNAKYLQQIVELEGESKKVSELQKSVEEVQRDLARAEKEKLEALETVHDKVNTIQSLKASLSAAENAKRMYESALKELRSQQEQEETLDSELRPVIHQIQTQVSSTEWMDRLEKLELENSTLRQRLEDQKRSSNGTHAHDIQGLYQEINDLHELLDHKDEEIQKLLSDKEKLESYTKSTLAKFQDKYLAALQDCKTKLKEKHEKILDLELKMESEVASHKREEKLMSSAVYELGLAIMQAKLKERY
jgi:protein HOOK3